LIVKEHVLRDPISQSTQSDPPSAGECIVRRRQTYSCLSDLRAI
jgi:hypothetical protein